MNHVLSKDVVMMNQFRMLFGVSIISIRHPAIHLSILRLRLLLQAVKGLQQVSPMEMEQGLIQVLMAMAMVIPITIVIPPMSLCILLSEPMEMDLFTFNTKNVNGL